MMGWPAAKHPAALRTLSREGREALRETLIALCVSCDVLPRQVHMGRQYAALKLRDGDRGRFMLGLVRRRRGLGFIYDCEEGGVIVFPCQDEEYQTP